MEWGAEDPSLEVLMPRGPPETSVIKSSTERMAPPRSGKKGLAVSGFSNKGEAEVVFWLGTACWDTQLAFIVWSTMSKVLDEALNEHVVLTKIALEVDHFVQDLLVVALHTT